MKIEEINNKLNEIYIADIRLMHKVHYDYISRNPSAGERKVVLAGIRMTVKDNRKLEFLQFISKWLKHEKNKTLIRFNTITKIIDRVKITRE